MPELQAFIEGEPEAGTMKTAEQLVEDATDDPRANPWQYSFVVELVQKAIDQERERCARLVEDDERPINADELAGVIRRGNVS